MNHLTLNGALTLHQIHHHQGQTLHPVAKVQQSPGQSLATHTPLGFHRQAQTIMGGKNRKFHLDICRLPIIRNIMNLLYNMLNRCIYLFKCN